MSIILNKVSTTLNNIGKLIDYQIKNYYWKDILQIDKNKLLWVREIYRKLWISHTTIKKYLWSKNIQKVWLKHILIIDDNTLTKATIIWQCIDKIQIKNAKEKRIILSYISYLLSKQLKKW